MNAFVALRYITFVLFLVFACLTGSFAALNLGYIVSEKVANRSVTAERLDVYLVSLSLVSILFLLSVTIIELCRKGAITSRIWFELSWIAVFFAAYLGGSIAATLTISGFVCHKDVSSKMACMASTVLIAFTWVVTSLHLLYFFILLGYTLLRSRHEIGTWNSAVLDHSPRQSRIPPVMITHTYSRSVDEPLGNVHHITFGEASQAESSPEIEKEMKKVGNRGIARPTFMLQPGMNGPLTFGNVGLAVGGDIESARNNDYRGDAGMNGIGRAPVHREYQARQRPYRPSVNEPPSSSSVGPEYAQNHPQAPWLSGEDTPSPAVIRHASRAVAAPPSVSLYPVHVVNTGLTTVPVKPQTPTAVGTLTGFLHVQNHGRDFNQSKTSLPYLNSSRATSQRTVSSNRGHSQGGSIESFVQVSEASSIEGGMAHRRTQSDGSNLRAGRKRIGPRPRPPPLNLIGLSNIANAERRQ